MTQTTQIPENTYLTSSEFAKAIGIHIQTLRHWDKTGKLKPHHKTPGGKRFYTRNQINTFLNNENV